MAGRKPGTPKTGGRKKGTPNKLTQDVMERLSAMGCDPLSSMARLAQEAEQEGDKQLAGRMYSELANYVAPKRKAIEQEIKQTPISAEEAKNECIAYLSMVSDEVRMEIFQALGITTGFQPTPQMQKIARDYHISH